MRYQESRSLQGREDVKLRYVSWVVSDEEMEQMVNSVIGPFLARGFMPYFRPGSRHLEDQHVGVPFLKDAYIAVDQAAL